MNFLQIYKFLYVRSPIGGFRTFVNFQVKELNLVSAFVYSYFFVFRSRDNKKLALVKRVAILRAKPKSIKGRLPALSFFNE